MGVFASSMMLRNRVGGTGGGDDMGVDGVLGSVMMTGSPVVHQAVPCLSTNGCRAHEEREHCT
jgi:hypothetical protein